MDLDQARELVRRQHHAVLATWRSGGTPQLSPVTAGVDDDGYVVISSRQTAYKVKNLRRDPRATLTVMDGESWYRQVTLLGRAVEIRDDPEFKDIDRLSLRYTRRQFNNRLRTRISALIEPESWYGWQDSSHWP